MQVAAEDIVKKYLNMNVDSDFTGKLLSYHFILSF